MPSAASRILPAIERTRTGTGKAVSPVIQRFKCTRLFTPLSKLHAKKKELDEIEFNYLCTS